MAHKLTTFVIRVTLVGGTVKQHTTRQRDFTAAEAWACSKYFQSIQSGAVSMIAVTRAESGA